MVMAHVAVLHCLLEDSNLLGYERELLEQGKCQSQIIYSRILATLTVTSLSYTLFSLSLLDV